MSIFSLLCDAHPKSLFSLERIKTYLTLIIGENRLNELVLINVHPEIIIKL